MCFMIDPNIAPWKETTVFKVLTKSDLYGEGVFCSPFMYGSKITRWEIGKSVSAFSPLLIGHWMRECCTKFGYRPETARGIYTFQTLSDAQNFSKFVRGNRLVIGVLKVSPSNFLHAGIVDQAMVSATYRKVTLVEVIDEF